MEQIRLWRNEQIAILRQNEPLSKEDQENYFTQQVEPSFLQQQPSNILFSFLKDDSLIGYGGLVHLDWKERTVEISFLLGTPEDAELSTLIDLLKEAAFQDLELHTLTAEVYDFGPQRKKALELAGFNAYRTEKNRTTYGGQTAGSIFYRLSRDEQANV